MWFRKRLCGTCFSMVTCTFAFAICGRVDGQPTTLPSHKLGPTWQREYANVAAEVERLSRELANTSTSFASARQRLSLSLKDVQNCLAPDEALVDYLKFGNFYAVWVLTREGKPKRIELGEASAIERAAARFREDVLATATDGRNTAWLSSGGILRKSIWSAAEAAMGARKRRVFIVPDSILGIIPFAAIQGRKPNSTLLDEYVISYLGVAQDLVPWDDQAKAGTGLLAIGGVDYMRAAATMPDDEPIFRAFISADHPVHSSRRNETASTVGMPAMEGAPDEVKIETLGECKDAVNLYAVLRPNEPAGVFQGSDATVELFRALAPGRRAILLATHGFVRSDIGPGEDTRQLLPSDERHLITFDPMLLSGLAFAGCNAIQSAGAPSGVLTALDVSSLNLIGVELVVLSACETASGTPTDGEGVLGLVRGFHQAGCRNIIASLWRVQPGPTRQLIGQVLKGCFPSNGSGAPLDPATALTLAARALKGVDDLAIDPVTTAAAGYVVKVRSQPFAAPWFWASFVAYGR